MTASEENTPLSSDISERYHHALREIKSLRLEIKNLRSDLSEGPSDLHSLHGLDLLLLRFGADGIIKYANTAFCSFFSVGRGDLIGANRKILGSLPHSSLLEPLNRLPSQGSRSLEALDDKGDTYLIKITHNQADYDVVMENITDKQKFREYVQKYIGTDFNALKDEDLTSFRYPERRLMSVSFTNIRGFTKLSETLVPEAVRKMLNGYLQSVISSIENNQGSLDKIMGDEVMALFGAPRYFRDHALRVLKAAFDQLLQIEAVRQDLERQGLNLPGCGIGISTGDMVVGSIGSENRKNYTVLGSSVSIGAKLAHIARDAEVLLTESTLNQLFLNMPPGWIIREMGDNPDQPGEEVWKSIPGLQLPLQTKAEGGIARGIYPLTENAGRTFAIGTPSQPIYQFRYVYALRVHGVAHLIPIIQASLLDTHNFPAIKYAEPTLYDGIRMLGKYQLIEILGKGGMGEVWKAKDGFGNIVAVKTLLSQGRSRSKSVLQFLREAKIMSKLQHKNICRIFEVGELDNIPYIVMEYIEGTPLSQVLTQVSGVTGSLANSESVTLRLPQKPEKIPVGYIENNSTLSTNLSTGTLPPVKKPPLAVLPGGYIHWKQALTLTQKLCAAIGFAHAHGIIHRDIKPQNIMIRPDGEPVLMDFGVAKMADHPETGPNEKKQVFGTLEYMAPEQVHAKREDDSRVDIYGLGAVLYQILTGQKHFKASKNIISDLKRLQNYLPKPPRSHNKSIPTDLNFITLKALAPHPSHRYQSIEQLANDLQQFLENKPVLAHPPGIAYRVQKNIARFKSQYTVASAFFLVLVTFLSILFIQNHRQTGNWINVYNYTFPLANSDFQLWTTPKNSTVRKSGVPLNQKGFALTPGIYFYVAESQQNQLYRDLRFEADFVWQNPEFDVEFWFYARTSKKYPKRPESGYCLNLGAAQGTLVHFYKINQNGEKSLEWQGPLPYSIHRDKAINVSLEKNKNFINIYINEKLLLSHEDLSMGGNRKDHNFVMYSRAPELYMKHFSLQRAAMPQVTSPLSAAEALGKGGNYTEAFEEYISLSQDYEGSSVAEEALARAYQVAITQLNSSSQDLNQLYKEMLQQYPGSPWIVTLDELNALYLWKNGSYSEALKLIKAVLQKKPQSSLPYWLGEKSIPEDVEAELINLLGSSDALLSYTMKSTLYAGQFFPAPKNLKVLTLPSINLESLNNTLNSSMVFIDARNNNISQINDLPLSQLVYLNLNFNHLNTFPALQNSKLRALLLAGNQLSTLPPLPPLTYLDISYNYLTQADPSWSKIYTLNASSNHITGPLPNELPYNLNLSHNPLVYLEAPQNRSHGHWDLSHTSLKNLDQFSGHKFEKLNLSFTQITQIPSNMVVKDLVINQGILKNNFVWPQNLNRLQCSPCSVDNATWPAGLRTLDLSYSGLKTLNGLGELSLRSLDVEGNPLVDFDRFLQSPPDTFKFFHSTLDPELVRKALKLWMNTQSDFNVSYAQLALALLLRAPEEAKKFGFLFHGFRYLVVPFRVTPAEAQNLANSLGAQLANLEDKIVSNRLEGELPPESEYWIGLQRIGNELVWSNKTPIRQVYTYRPLRLVRGQWFALKAGYNRWIDLDSEEKRGFILQWPK